MLPGSIFRGEPTLHSLAAPRQCWAGPEARDGAGGAKRWLLPRQGVAHPSGQAMPRGQEPWRVFFPRTRECSEGKHREGIGVFFFSLSAGQRSCVTREGSAVLPPWSGCCWPPPYQSGCWEPRVPPLSGNSRLFTSSPALAAASKKLVALSGFKWLLHNTGCQAR